MGLFFYFLFYFHHLCCKAVFVKKSAFFIGNFLHWPLFFNLPEQLVFPQKSIKKACKSQRKLQNMLNNKKLPFCQSRQQRVQPSHHGHKQRRSHPCSNMQTKWWPVGSCLRQAQHGDNSDAQVIQHE